MLGALAASPIRSRGVGVVRWWAAEARRRRGRRPVSVSRSSARSFGNAEPLGVNRVRGSSEDGRDAPNPSHPLTLGVNSYVRGQRRSRVPRACLGGII